MRYGIEAEFGLVDEAGALVDFVHPRWAELQAIVDTLPDLEDADLTRGDLAIKWTRWYVEGDERFDPAGRFLRCVPKGIETRTPISDDVPALLAALTDQVRRLARVAAGHGLRLTAVGHNPVHSTYRPEPAYNGWELAMRAEHPEYAAPEVYMCSYGPDVNLSDPTWDDGRAVLAGARLAAWAPEIVALSLNAPFVDGRAYGGLSYRTAVRAGRRPSVRVFVPDGAGAAGRAGPASAGLAVRPPRIPAERGRIEFKALDAFADLGRFGAWAALLGGLARAERLPTPAEVAAAEGVPLDVDPAARLRSAAATGLADDALAARCAVLLELAEKAWRGAPEADLLAPLHRQLDRRAVPADALLEAFEETGRPPLPDLVLP